MKKGGKDVEAGSIFAQFFLSSQKVPETTKKNEQGYYFFPQLGRHFQLFDIIYFILFFSLFGVILFFWMLWMCLI